MSNLLLSKIGHVISEFPLAFKQTKEVKLFMTLLVKNEEGMLEENLQFHKAMGVDGFIITDNNSTDSTPDIIRKYKQKGWIKEVIEEKATNYEQKDWVDRLSLIFPPVLRCIYLRSFRLARFSMIAGFRPDPQSPHK